MEPLLRPLALAAAWAFLGSVVLQYVLIFAMLGGSTALKTSDWHGTNWAWMLACKIAAASVMVACSAACRRWALLKSDSPTWAAGRITLVVVNLVLAFRMRWVTDTLIYPDYGSPFMAEALWFAGFPFLLVASALLPFRWSVTGCALGALVSGIVFSSGGSVHSSAGDGAYAITSPLVGALFAILCLGSGEGMTRRQRLPQVAGVGVYAAIVGALTAFFDRGASETLGIILYLLAMLAIPVVPAWIERRSRTQPSAVSGSRTASRTPPPSDRRSDGS